MSYQNLVNEEKQLHSALILHLSPYLDKNVINIIMSYLKRPWYEFFVTGFPVGGSDFSIGGSNITEHNGDWLDVFQELPGNSRKKYDRSGPTRLKPTKYPQKRYK